MGFMQVKKIDPNATVPHRAHDTDAGLDVCAIENGCVHAGKDAIIRTGLAISIPDGWVAIVKEKSGRATKNKITIGACVIDSGYRGEVLIHLFNNDPVLPFTYKTGEKIAQLVVVPCWTGQPEEVKELDETKRGDGGFGSTGNLVDNKLDELDERTLGMKRMGIRTKDEIWKDIGKTAETCPEWMKKKVNALFNREDC